ncbi:MAG: hypothetical protein LBB65_06315 [Burkholderiales bacterium]|jgi:type II secretory pathway pseudopilin PulG|nr:hypothetical protein [Burkholderiales bacterium]
METTPENTVVDSEYWRINKKKFERRLKKLIVVMVLLFLAAVLVRMQYCDYMKRARVSEFVISLRAAQDAITEQLKENPPKKIDPNLAKLIPAELSFSVEGRRAQISYKTVSSEGKIIAFSPQFGVLLVLTPQAENDAVTWTCWASASLLRDIPLSCRDNKPSAQSSTSAR